MPTFICSAIAGRLTPVQKTEIARSITNIYHEEFGSPRYFVEVIFHDVAPGNYYVAARPAPADPISITGEIRSGRTDEQRSRMGQRIMQEVARASGAAEDTVWVHLLESSFADVVEYGPRAGASRGGERMVLVATRHLAGEAKAPGLTKTARTP